jgi:DnaA regulatory inactivator Hda
MSESQLPLDLGHRPALSANDFLVAACNAEAHAWLARWPRWPGPALALFGPAGSGKTHLAHLFAAAAGAAIIAGPDLRVEHPPLLLARARTVVVEDADRGVDEVALFHLINLVKETGGHLLLTGREAPARWRVRLPDLRSRLNAMPVVAIGAPDDAVLAAVLVKLFADRQLKVGEELVAYVVDRMERSFAGATHLVETLDRASLAERRAVTVPLARAVLEGLGEKDDRQGELSWT